MAEVSFKWELEAYESRGNLHLRWNTNSPFRAQQGQIRVYKGNSFPSNPEADTAKWSWDDQNGGGSGWDTGLNWGKGWHCAYIAQSSPNGPNVSFLRLVTDESMGPNVTK